MSGNTSIVLVHRGDNWYLHYSLNQIVSLGAGSTVFLLGDEKTIKSFGQIKTVNLNDLYSRKAMEFVDNYVHMCTNPYDFELFCFLRWFHLLEFMKSEKIDKVLYLDSDILLYTPLVDILNMYKGILLNCGYMIPQQEHESLFWAASGHTSYWHYEALDEFCKFLSATYKDSEINRLYQKKWDYHKNRKVLGGVNDMTAFYLYWRRESKHITNLSEIVQGGTFDHNINVPMNLIRDEYKMRGPIKMINFKSNIPFGETVDQGREERYHTLHFQGDAKNNIPAFYTGKPFSRKLSHDIAWYILRTKEKLRQHKKN